MGAVSQRASVVKAPGPGCTIAGGWGCFYLCGNDIDPEIPDLLFIDALSFWSDVYFEEGETEQRMRIFREILFGLMILLVGASSTQGASLPSWSFSIKAGAYQPSAEGYDAQYGNPREFRIDLDLGYKITRRIEAGLSIGYFNDNGLALGAISGTTSGVKQQLVLIPTQLYLVYEFAFKDGQILVPYLGGGYTHITYRRYVEGQGTVMGGQDGYHARAGLKFLLNQLEPRAADRLYESSGISNTYFLLEGQYARVDGFGTSSVDLGGWSYFVGIQFEF
jgi:hypothetical protein